MISSQTSGSTAKPLCLDILLPLSIAFIAMSACTEKTDGSYRYIAEGGERLVVVENLRNSEDGRLADLFYYWPEPISIEGEEVSSATVTRLYRCETTESSSVRGTMTTVSGRQISHEASGYQFSADQGTAIKIVCDKSAADSSRVPASIDDIIKLYKEGKYR